jgi:hypothetical protein
MKDKTLMSLMNLLDTQQEVRLKEIRKLKIRSLILKIVIKVKPMKEVILKITQMKNYQMKLKKLNYLTYRRKSKELTLEDISFRLAVE